MKVSLYHEGAPDTAWGMAIHIARHGGMMEVLTRSLNYGRALDILPGTQRHIAICSENGKAFGTPKEGWHGMSPCACGMVGHTYIIPFRECWKTQYFFWVWKGLWCFATVITGHRTVTGSRRSTIHFLEILFLNWLLVLWLKNVRDAEQLL